MVDDGSLSRIARWTMVSIVLLMVAAGAAAQLTPPPPDTENLNPLLGPEYARWLMGPIADIATKAERERYLSLTSDAEAERFIRDFWDSPEHELVRDLFEQRAAEADRRFTEAHVAGRRTDRGRIFILYGEPEEVGLEEFRNVDDGDVLIWRYDRGESGKGLDGRKPSKTYRFTRVGDLTRLFKPGGPLDPAERRRRDPRNQIYGRPPG